MAENYLNSSVIIAVMGGHKKKRSWKYILPLAGFLIFLILIIYLAVNQPSPIVEKKVVRQPVFAGQFYPATASELDLTVKAFLASSKGDSAIGRVRALVVPHAGYVYSGQVAAEGFKLVDPSIKTVIIMGPNHQYPLNGASIINATHYSTPLGEIKVSNKTKILMKNKIFADVPLADAKEHSIEVELPFLQETLKDFEIVPIVVGNANPEEIANALIPIIDENTLVVASSDLSHYYAYDKAMQLDKVCTDAIPALNITQMSSCEACGKIPILTLMHISEAMGWEGKLIDSKNSGDTAGDKSRVVGYSSIAFVESGELNSEEQQFLITLARQTLNSYLRDQKKPEPALTSPRLKKVQGCFVTLNKNNNLRGCIGHILPQEELYKCVIDNAVAAAIHDSRFKPVTYDELNDITLDISVLSVPAQLSFATPQDLLDKLVPLKHGVVLNYLGRSSTFLPQVWEQIPNKEEFLSELCRKQGSPPLCWQDKNLQVSTYTAQVFSEG